MKKFILVSIGLIQFFCAASLFLHIDIFELYLFSVLKGFDFKTVAVISRLLLGILFATSLSYVSLTTTKKLNFYITNLFIATTIVLFIFSFVSEDIRCVCFLLDFLNFRFNIPLCLLILSLLSFIASSCIENPFLKKNSLKLYALFAVVATTALAIRSAPDFIIAKKASSVNINYQNNDLSPSSISTIDSVSKVSAKRIIAFVDPDCEYCQKSLVKLQILTLKNDLTAYYTILVGGNEQSLEKVIDYYHLSSQPYATIKLIDIVKLSGGTLPFIVLMENGKIKYTFNYRNLDEDIINQFFK